MFAYPKVRKDLEAIDEYHGHKILDSFKWLEDNNSEETINFVKQQNEVTNKYFNEQCQGRDKIRQKIEEKYNYEKFSCPRQICEDLFVYQKNDGLQNQYTMYKCKNPEDIDINQEVLLDQNLLSQDGTACMQSYDFTQDGKLMAYSVSYSGSDYRTIYVKDVQTRQDLPDKILKVKFSNHLFDKEGKGLFYGAMLGENQSIDENEDLGTQIEKNTGQKLFYHKLGTQQQDDILIYEDLTDPNQTYGSTITDDRKYYIITSYKSCDPENNVYYLEYSKLNLNDKSQPFTQPIQLIDGYIGGFDFICNNDNLFYFKTNYKTNNSKIICIDINNPDQSNWKTVVPERESLLESAICINKNHLILIYLEDVKNVVRQYNLDGYLEFESIELPSLGNVAAFTGETYFENAFFSFNSFLYPGSIFQYNPNTGKSRLLKEISVKNFDPSNFVTEQVFYTSYKDKTKIPMFLIYPKSLEKNGNNPTFLYGYGGFNISLTPYFSSIRIALLELMKNGLIAIPNLRGGGEYGESWHKQGTKELKQNVFDDFISAAEYLIKEKFTNKSKICISGGSNGGLLVAACTNQRPDLFKAVLCDVGVLDMLKFHKFTIGHYWCSDYGSSDNLTDFSYLLAYSPYHNVRSNVQYPAMLLSTADHDDRVVPLHSYKLIAQLQDIVGSQKFQNNPLLIRIEEKAGHGAGKPTSKIIDQYTDQYSFILKNLGVDL